MLPPLPVDSPRAQVIRAYERGDYAEVIEACTAHLAVDSMPEGRALYTYYWAAAHHQLSQPAQAITLWTKLREEQPNAPFGRKALLGIGLAQASLGDWAACEAACEQYLLGARQGSDVLLGRYWYGEALAQQGRWAAATEAFRDVVQQGEGHALQVDARFALVECLAVQGDVPAAFEGAMELAGFAPGHPEYGRSWLRVAQAAHNAGDAVRARDAARAAVEADETLALPAAIVLAQVALTAGDPTVAYELLQPQLAAPAPSAVRARMLAALAWAAFEAGEHSRAVALYQQVAHRHPGALQPQDDLRLAMSYRALGDLAATLDVLARLQGEPKLASLADVVNAILAQVSRRTGAPLAAVHLLETGLREWPTSSYTPWRHERLGRSALERGQWREMGEAYRAAADTAEDEPAALFAWIAAYADAQAQHWPRARRQLATTGPLPEPHAARASALAGDIAAAQGRWTEAALAYRDGAQRATGAEAAALYVRSARAGAVAGDRGALEALAAELNPSQDTAEVWLMLGLLMSRDGEVQAARDVYAIAAAQGGTAAAQARFHLGWDSLQQGKPGDAVTQFSGVRFPDALEPWARYGLALAHLGRGAYRVAATEFSEVALRFAGTPPGDDAALRAGDALNGAGAWRRAEQAYLAASQQVTDPDAKRRAMLGVGWTLAERRFTSSAEEAFEAALRGKADDADAAQVWLWRGREAFAEERHLEAAACFARAIAAQPAEAALARAEYWYARSLWEQRQYVAAAATFASCRSRAASAPYRALAGYWEVRCADALGDDAAVLANVAALRRTHPETASWVALDLAAGAAHRRREEWDAALRAYDRVAAADAGAAGVRATIDGAACLEAMGDLDGAIVRLFRIRPGEHPAVTVAEARLALGRTLVRAGRTPDARQVLLDVVQQYPETEAARAARAALQELAVAPA